MQALARSLDAIEALLRRGLAPVTDNRDALLSLGFDRSYPQVRSGYEATIWERGIELPRRSDGCRVMARERAYLVDKVPI